MTEPENNAPLSRPPAGGRGFLWFILILALVIAAGVFAAPYWPLLRDRLLPAVSNAGPSQERLAAVEQKIQALDERVNALEARIDTIASAPAPAASVAAPAHAPPAPELAHIQSDLATVATTVGDLQNRVKQTNASTQASLAKLIAFMQLRDAATSNRGFAKELDVMRAAAKSDPDLKAPLDALAPYAEKGAPDIASLRAALEDETSATEVAVAKAGAQTWWERVLAEFRGLVLIRPLRGADAQGDALAAMKTALAQNDLPAALDGIKNLPPEAQKTLETWHKQAEARNVITQALQAIADRLAAGGDTSSPSSGQDKDAP